jgi:hypothetical protein
MRRDANLRTTAYAAITNSTATEALLLPPGFSLRSRPDGAGPNRARITGSISIVQLRSFLSVFLVWCFCDDASVEHASKTLDKNALRVHALLIVRYMVTENKDRGSEYFASAHEICDRSITAACNMRLGALVALPCYG